MGADDGGGNEGIEVEDRKNKIDFLFRYSFVSGPYLGFCTGTSFGNVQLDEQHFGQHTEHDFFHQRRHASTTHPSASQNQLKKILFKALENIYLLQRFWRTLVYSEQKIQDDKVT